MAITLLALTFGGLVLLVIGLLALKGRLRRNHVAGIRTPYTMRSDENWHATHRHAAPVLIFSGVAVTTAGLALLPFAAAGVLPEGFVAVVSGVMAAFVLGAAIGSWLYGTHRARAELEGR